VALPTFIDLFGQLSVEDGAADALQVGSKMDAALR
jgi:hypothetical protein